MINEKTANQKHYNRTGDKFIIRTAGGRLVASAQHIEYIESDHGGSRTLWKLINDFGTSKWIAR